MRRVAIDFTRKQNYSLNEQRVSWGITHGAWCVCCSVALPLYTHTPGQRGAELPSRCTPTPLVSEVPSLKHAFNARSLLPLNHARSPLPLNHARSLALTPKSRSLARSHALTPKSLVVRRTLRLQALRSPRPRTHTHTHTTSMGKTVCVQVLHEKLTPVAHWLACAGSVIHDDNEQLLSIPS
jgi:hypothetical protein